MNTSDETDPQDDRCCDAPSVLMGDQHERKHVSLAVTGFWAIWRGASPSITELLNHEAADPVSQLVDEGRIEIDGEGRLRGIHGLTLEATRHQIRRKEGHVHTWCALDAIGIPAALGIDAIASTSCPRCDRELLVRMVNGVPDPSARGALWIPASDCGHLREDFCQHANLFCSLEHLEQHHGNRARAITLEEAASLGRAMWADVVGGQPGEHR